MINSVVIGGLGMVGKATRKRFGIEDYFDLKGSTITLKEIAMRKKYVFLCLNAPTTDDGVDASDTFQIIKQIKEYPHGEPKIYIIRSTVLPGTTRHFGEQLGINTIVHNPEFLTENTWEKDALNPDIAVIGADDPNAGKAVEGIYKSRFKGLDIFLTDSVTSELVKYGINCFYATKVVYANELYDAAQQAGANYEKIKEIMYKRRWIGNNHLNVFHKGYRGFDGKCFPKDMKAFQQYSNSKLIKTALEVNTSLK